MLLKEPMISTEMHNFPNILQSGNYHIGGLPPDLGELLSILTCSCNLFYSSFKCIKIRVQTFILSTTFATGPVFYIFMFYIQHSVYLLHRFQFDSQLDLVCFMNKCIYLILATKLWQQPCLDYEGNALQVSQCLLYTA